MPKGPNGQKRPADVVSNAVLVMRIATGELGEPADTRNQAALALSRLGASKGGRTRAARLSPRRRKESAREASKARWAKGRQP